MTSTSSGTGKPTSNRRNSAQMLNMHDFRKKLNVAAALRHQQQQQQQQHHQHHLHQQHHHPTMSAVFQQQTGLRPPPPPHLMNSWNLLNPANFTSQRGGVGPVSGPGPQLPPPLMHHSSNTHSMHNTTLNRNTSSLFGAAASMMAPRFNAPPMHANLPSSQQQHQYNSNSATTTPSYDFYNQKMLMN